MEIFALIPQNLSIQEVWDGDGVQYQVGNLGSGYHVGKGFYNWKE